MAKQKISIVRGTTNVFAVAVADESGEAYTLASGEVLRFGVKKRPGDAEYLFAKEAIEANASGEDICRAPHSTRSRSLVWGRRKRCSQKAILTQR